MRGAWTCSPGPNREAGVEVEDIAAAWCAVVENLEEMLSGKTPQSTVSNILSNFSQKYSKFQH